MIGVRRAATARWFDCSSY